MAKVKSDTLNAPMQRTSAFAPEHRRCFRYGVPKRWRYSEDVMKPLMTPA